MKSTLSNFFFVYEKMVQFKDIDRIDVINIFMKILDNLIFCLYGCILKFYVRKYINASNICNY